MQKDAERKWTWEVSPSLSTVSLLREYDCCVSSVRSFTELTSLFFPFHINIYTPKRLRFFTSHSPIPIHLLRCMDELLLYFKKLDKWWYNLLLERWRTVRTISATITLLKAELLRCQFDVTSQKSSAYVHASVVELVSLQSTLWVCIPRHTLSCLDGKKTPFHQVALFLARLRNV